VIVLNDEPKLVKYENVFDIETCNQIIALSKENMYPGKIVDGYGNGIVDTKERNASTFHVEKQKYNSCIHSVLDKVQEVTGVNKDRMERFTITHYELGQYFNTHQDYFVDIPENQDKLASICELGGNRVTTIILYLNNVPKGGETYFPWLEVMVEPEAGSFIKFDYDYDDDKINIKSQHLSLPVLEGEKWIVTFFVREKSHEEKVSDFKHFNNEKNVYSQITDLTYTYNFKNKDLVFTLPGNDDPMNSIIVGFTGGMDSCLLLYILGALNNCLEIPYIIQPICVTGNLIEDDNKVNENSHNVQLMCNLIREKVGGNIKKLYEINCPKGTKREMQVFAGIHRWYTKSQDLYKYNELHNFLRTRNHKFVYVATNKFPDDGDSRWNVNWKRWDKPSNIFFQPFAKLLKTEILELIYELELEFILENTANDCEHSSLDDVCEYFQCNERRWAFKMLNKHDDGIKYFCQKRKKNE